MRHILRRLKVIKETIADLNEPQSRHPAGHGTKVTCDDDLISANVSSASRGNRPVFRSCAGQGITCEEPLIGQWRCTASLDRERRAAPRQDELVSRLSEDHGLGGCRQEDRHHNVSRSPCVAVHGYLISGASRGRKAGAAGHTTAGVIVAGDAHQTSDIRTSVNGQRRVKSTSDSVNRGSLRHQRGPRPPDGLVGGAVMGRFSQFGGRAKVGGENPVAAAGDRDAIGKHVIWRRKKEGSGEAAGESRLTRGCNLVVENHLTTVSRDYHVGTVNMIASDRVWSHAVISHGHRALALDACCERGVVDWPQVGHNEIHGRRAAGPQWQTVGEAQAHFQRAVLCDRQRLEGVNPSSGHGAPCQ